MNRAEECHYDEKRQKSRTQKLKERLSMLEDRIRELESDPSASSLVPDDVSAGSSDTPSPPSFGGESRPYSGELYLTHPNSSGHHLSWDTPSGPSGSSLTASVHHGSSFSMGPLSYDDMHNLESSLFVPIPRWNSHDPLPDDTRQHL